MRRWPLCINPYPDEILSSFLVRAAIRHGQLPYGFGSFWWPSRPVWNRDLDRGEDDAWLRQIAAQAGLDLERVRATTLDEPRRRFRVRSGDTPLILSAGIFHRTRTAHAHQYCPRCLREAEYVRRLWRYSFVVACPRCETALRDACPSCGAPVVPHRSHRIGACHACGRSLTASTRGDDAPARGLVLPLQATLLARLDRVPGATLGPWDDDAMFTGVRSLITVARHPNVLPALRSALGLDPSTVATGRFERMRAADRAVILETVAHWLGDWPNHFFVAAGQAGLTQRTFRRVAQPGDLAVQILHLPEGLARDRTFVPVLQDKTIKRLRRNDRPGYRRLRATRLIDATQLRR